MTALTQDQVMMTTAFEFLRDGATASQDSPLARLGESPDDYPNLVGQPSICPLTDRGAILATGADTCKLLQGQLTCDLNQLAAAGSLKGALCDVKGRMVCSLSCVHAGPDAVLLLLHRGLVGMALETLNKYAVFFKTTLEDVSDRYAVMGVQQLPPQGLSDRGVYLSPINDTLGLLVSPVAEAEPLWHQLTATHQPCGEALWTYLLIAGGEGEVRPQTSAQFIPQMLNFQHTGAISFRKGCYTGQEIVARMQYLGKLKRRMYHLSGTGTQAFSPGQTVASGGKSDVGTVVLAAADGSAQHLLAVLTADAAEDGNLSIGSFNGHFDIVPLPYEDRLHSATQ